MEIKDRFTCTQRLRAFFRWIVASKARALCAAGNAPDPVWKNPGGYFWTKRNTNKCWKLGTQKQVNCNRKIGRIELAESSWQIWASNFLSLNPSCHRRNKIRFKWHLIIMKWHLILMKWHVILMKCILCRRVGLWMATFHAHTHTQAHACAHAHTYTHTHTHTHTGYNGEDVRAQEAFQQKQVGMWKNIATHKLSACLFLALFLWHTHTHTHTHTHWLQRGGAGSCTGTRRIPANTSGDVEKDRHT